MLEEKALKLRRMIVRIASVTGAGHITSSLSSRHHLCIIFGRYMRYDPESKAGGTNLFSVKDMLL